MAPSHPACILLLSHSREPFCTDRVAAAIEARGGAPLRVDTDAFPAGLPIEAELGPSQARLCLGGEPVRADAVWFWRLWPARLDERLGAAHREAGQREAASAMLGFFDLLGDAAWLDPPDHVRAAENKTRQLRLASEVGLTIPSTLITAEPASVRRFFDEHGGQVITKMQTALGFSMSGGGFPTRMLRAGDLASLDALKHCPMMFQNYIPKARELRVMWVDGEAFAGALDGPRCGVDWRHDSTAPWEHAALPPQVHARLAQVMDRLGLRQGAIDLIETPAGDHVFLEVNPLGEWGMLERDLGLPISGAIAGALLRLAA